MNAHDLDHARQFAHAHHAEALDLLRTLARIPAPSHHEKRRATFIRDWMEAQGMEGAHVDEANNVIWALNDDGGRDLVVFAAHTDVVFPDTDALPLSERDGRLYAPGVGDDTANLVALLVAARQMAREPQALPEGLGMLVVANSCEEGLGNLKGTRQLFATYGSRIRRFYSFDLYLPQVIHEAVGSLRWRITVRTQGGHSFEDYGRPNAVERLCAVIQALYALPMPAGAVCTRNVGPIEGGTTVNAIPAQASALFEYRSTADAELQGLARRMRQTVEAFGEPGVEVSLESLGERPASAAATDRLRRMTEVSHDVMQAITGQQVDESPASTDANIPLSLGIPANTIGAVRGALLHTRDEWIDAASVEEGLAVVYALMHAQGSLEG